MNSTLAGRKSAIATIAAAVATVGICVGAVIHESAENNRVYQEATATYEPDVDFADYTPKPVER